MIDLSIVIINFNVKEFLQNLLDSINKATKGISKEIIIIDNASTDGSIDMIRDKFPAYKLIVNEKNIGFSAANNLGLKLAEGKYIVLINPDTIVREDTFKKLIEFFEHTPNAGMIGCKVLNPDGSLQLSCRRSFPGPWTSFTKIMGLSTLFPNSKLFARYNLTYLDENETYEVDAISGAFMMMTKDVYKKVGGFDPQFFMYGEDLDLCYRIQQAGYKVYYFHEAEIIHYKGESTKRSNLDETKLFYDAMHLFVKKHLSSSFLVESILQAGILLRKFIAFIILFRLVILAVILDTAFFSFSIYLAEKIYNPSNWLGFPDLVKPWVYFIPAILQIMISAFAGAYKINSISVLRSLVSILLGLIILSSITFFFKQYAYSRAVLLITYSGLIIFFPLWRIIVKVFFKIGLSSSSRKLKTLIVGTDSGALAVADKLKSGLHNVHQIVGLIDLSMKKYGEKIGNHKVLGSLENIQKIIFNEKINEVIFSTGELSFSQIFSVVSSCQGEEVEFVVAGNDLDYLVGKSSVTMLDNIPLLKLHYNISSLTNRISKNIFDFLLSLVILIFVYPFVYLTSLIFRRGKKFSSFVLEVPGVIIGQKSFVGPKLKSSYSNLFLGKIGLTGLWYTEKVNETDAEENIKLDIYYARNQNIWLDLEILGKTFAIMFIRREK